MTPLHGVHQWAAATRLTQPDFDPAVDAVDVDAAPLGAGGTNEGFGDLFLDPDDNPDGTQDIGPSATYAQAVVTGTDGLGCVTPSPNTRPLPVLFGPSGAGRISERPGAVPAAGTPASKTPLRRVVAAQIAAKGAADPTEIRLFDGEIVIRLFHSAGRIHLQHPKRSDQEFSYSVDGESSVHRLEHDDNVSEHPQTSLSFRVTSPNRSTQTVKFVHTQGRWDLAVPAAKAAPVPPAAGNPGTLGGTRTGAPKARVRDLAGPPAEPSAEPSARPSDTQGVEILAPPRPAASSSPIAGLIEDVRGQLVQLFCGAFWIHLPELAIGMTLYQDGRYHLRIGTLPPGVRLERLLHEDEGKVVSIPSHTYSIDYLPASGLLTLFVTHDGTRVRLEFEKLPNGDWRLEDRFTG